MALILKDRVKQQTTTTGTGTYTLSGSFDGFDVFTEIGDGNETYYCCTDGTDFEVGRGTFTASGTTLSREEILSSSNSDAAVNWTAGTRTIFCTQPADKAVFLDGSGNISIPGTIDGRDLATDGTKLDGIESGATADQSASEILTAVKTVDGAASGLDADLLDGQHGSYYTGYTDSAVANLVDSAPTTLDTLNELAAALGDDANFSTTVTNSIATKLPLAGGTMTGNIVMSGAQTVDGRDLSVDGAKLDGIESGATADQTAAEIKTAYESNADTNAFTDADHTKLDGIETGADVTDTANVTAAGALMDSEVTNLAQVKAFDSSDYATAAQGTTADAALPKAGGTMTGGLVMSGGNITVDSGYQVRVTSSGTSPVLDIAGGGPNFIRFRPGSGFSNTADGVDILYRTAPNDLLIERSENANKIAEFGGDDGHAKLLYNGSDRIETTSGGTTVTGQLDGEVIELAGGVTYDPPGSGGTDTATDVGLALHSGARVVMGEGGYIRTIIDATASQPLQFGQSGTGYFAGSEIYGGAQGVKLFYNTSSKLQTLTGGVSVTGELDVSGDLDLEGALVEKVYNLTGTALDPSNGTLQYKTLSANTTFTETFADGESMTLMIDDGASYTVTWPTMTWASGSAPTLATTGYTTVVLWHQGGLYGAVVS